MRIRHDLLRFALPHSLHGAFTGDPATGGATLRFSVLSGASAMIETVPLGQAAAAYAKMMSGKARFRIVLTMDGENTGRM